MDSSKRKKLKAAGWKVGTPSDFLGLTPEEARYIELKVELSRELRRLRQKKIMTQADVAQALGSSQSRVAKAEAADASVSVDLLVRALIALGASRKDFARVFAAGGPRRA